MGFAGALNRVGPPGPAGRDGIDGKDGNAWHGGIGEPSSSLGVDGDFYLDYKASDVYQKADDRWFWRLNIKGKKGDKGDLGKDGITKLVSMGSLSGNGTPYITPKNNKILIVNKDDENTFVLPFECKKFIVRARKAAKLRLAFEPDHLITEDFLTIGLGGFYQDDNYYRQQTIYISSDKDNTIVEILTFI